MQQRMRAHTIMLARYNPAMYSRMHVTTGSPVPTKGCATTMLAWMGYRGATHRAQIGHGRPPLPLCVPQWQTNTRAATQKACAQQISQPAAGLPACHVLRGASRSTAHINGGSTVARASARTAPVPVGSAVAGSQPTACNMPQSNVPSYPSTAVTTRAGSVTSTQMDTWMRRMDALELEVRRWIYVCLASFLLGCPGCASCA